MLIEPLVVTCSITDHGVLTFSVHTYNITHLSSLNSDMYSSKSLNKEIFLILKFIFQDEIMTFLFLSVKNYAIFCVCF